MHNLNFFAAVLIGLAGSVHCLGMCGGIVSAFQLSLKQGSSRRLLTALYHTGRIASYCVAGAMAGALGFIIRDNVAKGLTLLTLVSGVMLILLGLYISNIWRVLVSLERLGQHLWRYLAPLSRRLLPVRHPLQALAYGAIWGWLPCGLVYSTLSWSLASGSAFAGAVCMLGFGLGTLPALISLSLLGQQFALNVKHPFVRNISALLLIGLGAFYILTSVR